MKLTQFYLTVALGAICLILSIVIFALGQSNTRLQAEFQVQQQEVQKGNVSQQIGTNIINDLGALAMSNPKIKDLLARNGINISQAPTPAATPQSR